MESMPLKGRVSQVAKTGLVEVPSGGCAATDACTIVVQYLEKREGRIRLRDSCGPQQLGIDL